MATCSGLFPLLHRTQLDALWVSGVFRLVEFSQLLISACLNDGLPHVLATPHDSCSNCQSKLGMGTHFNIKMGERGVQDGQIPVLAGFDDDR